MADAVLAFRNISKTFGKIRAVQDLSLEIERGEVFGLLGPNGAGKTTAVNMAIGVVKPDAGTVEIDGKGSPDDAWVRRGIGVAPQALAIYEDLTGEENLRFFGTIQGLRGRHLTERVRWALEFVNLYERRHDRVKTYSGGMKRRLNLVIALIHDPPLILMDEPTVGVDPQSRNSIFEKIETLRKEGRTLVYTTHYMEEAQRLCNRVGILDHGRLLAMDTVGALIAAHGGESTITGSSEAGEVRIKTLDPLAELGALGTRPGFKILTVESPNLEGVFLNLTGRNLRDEQ
jgi:ABC-2 type transport system ATP-binding protein